MRNNLRFIDADDGSTRLGKLSKWSSVKAVYCTTKNVLNLKSIAPKSETKRPFSSKRFFQDGGCRVWERSWSRLLYRNRLPIFRICNNWSVHRDNHFLCPDLKEIREVSQLNGWSPSQEPFQKVTSVRTRRQARDFVLLGRNYNQTKWHERFFCKLRQKVGGHLFPFTHVSRSHPANNLGKAGFSRVWFLLVKTRCLWILELRRGS